MENDSINHLIKDIDDDINGLDYIKDIDNRIYDYKPTKTEIDKYCDIDILPQDISYTVKCVPEASLKDDNHTIGILIFAEYADYDEKTISDYIGKIPFNQEQIDYVYDRLHKCISVDIENDR